MIVGKGVIVFAVVLLVLAVVVFAGFFKPYDELASNADLGLPERDKVCFGSECFVVEIVSDGEERQRGLMFRENLGRNSGMLFDFHDEGWYPFWMKNTLIDLDIIWINSQYEVVHIEYAVPCEADPCRNYGPGEKSARYVLEINGGLSDEIGLEIGDVLDFRLEQ
jgi:uncharacterized protein